MKPCKHDEVRDGCRICWLAANDPRYQKLWGIEPSQKPTIKGMDCIHLGKPTGATVACMEGCKGAKLKVFACAVYGKCTVAKKGEGVTATCRTCSIKQLANPVEKDVISGG